MLNQGITMYVRGMAGGARVAYLCAVENLSTLKHRELGNVHLLLGLLGEGNKNPSLPVGFALREAGARYEQLMAFLRNEETLRTDVTSVFIRTTRSLRRTLRRADQRARRRVGQAGTTQSDLAYALLKSRDPLLRQAWEHMGVDHDARKVLLQKFPRYSDRPNVQTQRSPVEG